MRIQRWLGYGAFAAAYLFIMSVAVLAADFADGALYDQIIQRR